ncbi:hypothetical protein [Plantactinospora sp. CA-290183]|uniref:hypothetical protein n=1 Tax=Plantactinospora sp. CA-290183 TaxID=3240006 RepID=UPI003D8B1EA8
MGKVLGPQADEPNPGDEEEDPPPDPPDDLGDAGRRLWSDVVGGFTLGPGELGSLWEACRTADELGTLRKALDGADMTVKGSQGQPVANPLLMEVRRHRETLTRLIDALSLPAGDEDAGMTQKQKRAQRAAQQRWRDRQATKKAASGGAA